MEQISYGAFSADLHQKQAGQRAPMQVSIEVTRRCPLECQHCYNNLPMGDQEARSREMTTEEHFRMLDELVEMGCFWLLYTGGEIFVRKDFLEIYTYAKKKGFSSPSLPTARSLTKRSPTIWWSGRPSPSRSRSMAALARLTKR
jgi:molybdenum cofactor biosynthesis enzyme MoaA